METILKFDLGEKIELSRHENGTPYITIISDECLIYFGPNEIVMLKDFLN